MRRITLPAAPVCQERCLGSRSVLSSTWTVHHVTFSWTPALAFCLLSSLQSTPGVSVLLVPLNELISSTRERFSFPSCSMIAFASHGSKLSKHLLSISRWKDSDLHRDSWKSRTGKWGLRTHGVCCIWLAHASRQLTIVQRAGNGSQ